MTRDLPPTQTEWPTTEDLTPIIEAALREVPADRLAGWLDAAGHRERAAAYPGRVRHASPAHGPEPVARGRLARRPRARVAAPGLDAGAGASHGPGARARASIPTRSSPSSASTTLAPGAARSLSRRVAAPRSRPASSASTTVIARATSGERPASASAYGTPR